MQINGLKNLEKELRRLIDKELPTILANQSVNFFKGNFDVQGWRGKTFKRWKNTRIKVQKFSKNPGILIESGHLKKSIRAVNISAGGFKVVAGNQKVPYAAIHNEGGKIKVTQKSRKYFWYMYRKTKDEFWKNMALTKKTYFTMPKRQFIGYSEMLIEELFKTTRKEFNKTFHKYLK